MKSCNEPTKKEILEMLAEINAAPTFSISGQYYQFVRRADGAIFRYCFNDFSYKFFNNIESFAKAVVRFRKRGW